MSIETHVLPMIPLRGLTMFPHITLHFDVGRPRSIAALNAAMQSDQLVFLTAQKDVRTEEPVRKDVYGIGVVAVLWPRNVIDRMDTFRPTFWRGLGLAVLTAWSILSFTGITTFIYSNF